MSGVTIIRADEIDGVVGDDVRAYVVGRLQRPQGFEHVSSDDVEIGVAGYPAAGVDVPHVHPTVTEAQIVVSGRVELRVLESGDVHVLGPGDFYLVEPGTAHVQKATAGTRVTVVKWPSLDDKTVVEPDAETLAWMQVPAEASEGPPHAASPAVSVPRRRRPGLRQRWRDALGRGTLASYQWLTAWRAGRIAAAAAFSVLLAAYAIARDIWDGGTWHLPRTVLGYGAVVGCAVVYAAWRASVATRRLTDRRFVVSATRDVRVVIAGFWQVVAEVDGERTGIAFGVHDRLTAAELRPGSLHAEFRRDRLGDVVGPAGVPVEIACARSLGDEVLVPGEADRWRLGTVVPVPFATHGSRGAEARRAYLLVNSTLASSEAEGMPAWFHGTVGAGEDWRGRTTCGGSHFDALLETVQGDEYPAETLVVPLLGTGYAARTTPTGAIYELVDAFFDAQLRHGASAMVRHLVISLHPSQVTDGHVVLKAVHDYIAARVAIHARML